ncbi:MAG TPA: hypothetical protein VJY33_07585, partial [Isosphaeraceae bacterium]|nr:hypothetical protein [Isosphaeraceae bacterium]
YRDSSSAAISASRAESAGRVKWLAEASLLLTFPELKVFEGPVADCLRAAGAPSTTLEAWREIASQEIIVQDDDEGY